MGGDETGFGVMGPGAANGAKVARVGPRRSRRPTSTMGR